MSSPHLYPNGASHGVDKGYSNGYFDATTVFDDANEISDVTEGAVIDDACEIRALKNTVHGEENEVRERVNDMIMNGPFQDDPSFYTHSKREVEKLYDIYSQHYEAYAEKFSHRGVIILANFVCRYIGTEDLNLRVLDVACGTGCAGRTMSQLGFSDIDGLDASANMLLVSKEKDVFTNLIHSFIEDCDQSVIPNDSYDILVAVGVIGPNHMQPNDLAVLHRITKPGGHLLIVGTDTLWNAYEEFYMHTQKKLDDMETQGAWQVVVNGVFDKYFEKMGEWHKARVILVKKL